MNLETALNANESDLDHAERRARQHTLSMAVTNEAELVASFEASRTARGPIAGLQAYRKVYTLADKVVVVTTTMSGGRFGHWGCIYDVYPTERLDALVVEAESFVNMYVI